MKVTKRRKTKWNKIGQKSTPRIDSNLENVTKQIFTGTGNGNAFMFAQHCFKALDNSTSSDEMYWDELAAQDG